MITFWLIAVLVAAIPLALVAILDFFTPHWDSLYDMRSDYEKWRDGK